MSKVPFTFYALIIGYKAEKYKGNFLIFTEIWHLRSTIILVIISIYLNYACILLFINNGGIITKDNCALWIFSTNCRILSMNERFCYVRVTASPSMISVRRHGDVKKILR